MRSSWRGLEEVGLRNDRSLGMDERPVERRPCVSCGGTGYRECPTCRALDSESTCQDCGGSGLEDCPICDEDGTVTTGRRWPF